MVSVVKVKHHVKINVKWEIRVAGADPIQGHCALPNSGTHPISEGLGLLQSEVFFLTTYIYILQMVN